MYPAVSPFPATLTPPAARNNLRDVKCLRAPFGSVRLLLLVAALAAGAAGCGSRPEGSRVIVLGFDGMEPAVVDLLMAEGKLPHFAKLRQEGAYGRLLSSRPLLSPVVWTTIATGRTPDQHRIGHFVAVNPKTGQELPVTSRMRQTKALWNIFSDTARSAVVVGWWATWPAETVRGAIVSDHLCYHFLMEEDVAKQHDDIGLTSPPELLKSISPLVRRPADLTAAELSPFVHVSPEQIARPFDFNDDLSHFKWVLATAESYRRIGLQLWKEQTPALEMVYVEGTDSTSHLFGHLFRAGPLSGELAEQQKQFGDAVEQIYIYADRFIGDFLDVMDDRTSLVVLSDHGFDLGALQDDPSKTRDMRRVSEKFHNMEGILYLYGHGVKPHVRLEQAAILDIAPTILALAGMPPAQDMAGHVLGEALTAPVPAPVPTYEPPFRSPSPETATDADVDPQILERLKSLGYMQATSPSGEKNLAAVLFESGRHDEAEKEYRRLIEAKPDDGSLRTSHAGALGALGRYDEALKELEAAIRLEPLNPEAYHNRAVIYERRGNKDAAIREYRTALRYSPEYEPSSQALARLQVSPRPNAPAGPEQQLANAMAQQAGEAARRGDYREAMRKLDEAQTIAPRFGLIYQYRSNVAYLMGDRDAAIAALKTGLEIEPDNALFRENLKNLQNPPQQPTPPAPTQRR